MLRSTSLVAILKGWPKATEALRHPSVTALFDRVVIGESIADVAAELDRSGPVVAVLQGPDSVPVLKRLQDANRPVWVHSMFAGLDFFKFGPELTAQITCPVTNARGVYSEMLAEHVLLSVLYFNRQVSKLQTHRRGRIWDRFASVPASQQVVGVIGYGDIGRKCAERLKGGLAVKDVLGYRRSALPSGAERDDIGVKVFAESTDPSALKTVLQSSDIILAVLPNTPATVGLLDREKFDWIAQTGRKPIFINIGRGCTVNETDLAAAMSNGVVSGAGLDVFAVEPLPQESPLWQFGDDKVLITSHNADISTDMELDAATHFLQLLRAYDVDKSLPSVLVDLKRGY